MFDYKNGGDLGFTISYRSPLSSYSRFVDICLMTYTDCRYRKNSAAYWSNDEKQINDQNVVNLVFLIIRKIFFTPSKFNNFIMQRCQALKFPKVFAGPQRELFVITNYWNWLQREMFRPGIPGILWNVASLVMKANELCHL